MFSRFRCNARSDYALCEVTCLYQAYLPESNKLPRYGPRGKWSSTAKRSNFQPWPAYPTSWAFRLSAALLPANGRRPRLARLTPAFLNHKWGPEKACRHAFYVCRRVAYGVERLLYNRCWNTARRFFCRGTAGKKGRLTLRINLHRYDLGRPPDRTLTLCQ